MSKLLSALIDQPESVVETAINKLEHLSGYESTDVRLLAEVSSKVRAKTAELGLDPDDTTSHELYHALRAKLAADEQKINQRLGFSGASSSDNYLERFSQFIQHASVHPEVWGIKWSVARKLLRDHPPKRLMKLLKYRSVDSMLKREFVGELYAALPSVESERWLNVLWRDIAALEPSDFENRRIQVVIMAAERWKNLPQKASVETLPHLGVIALWSGDEVKKLGVVGLGLEFFSAVAGLKGQSSYLKLRQFEAGFGEQLLEIIKHDLEPLLKFTSLSVEWHSLIHHVGRRQPADNLEWLPPHIQHEDVHTHKALDTMAELLPEMNWWRGLEHVAAHRKKQIVSLNLADIISDQSRQTAFQRRSLNHLRAGLWQELIDRYLQLDGVKSKTLASIEGQQLQPQTSDISQLNFDDFESKKQEVGI